jgi:DNA-binding transcriptional regulator YiaG
LQVILLAKARKIADSVIVKTLVRNVVRRRTSKTNRNNGAPPDSIKEAVFATHTAKNEFSVRTFCDSFGVTQDSFTRLTGFSPRAVAHWASGRTPSGSAQNRLTELTRLFDALSEMVNARAIGEWLKQPNPAFDGSTPLQVIERGETDRIWRMIWELQTGNTG